MYDLVENGAAIVLVDPVSLDFLRGAKIDFVDDLIGQSFKIENPNDGGDMSRSVGPYFRDELPPTAKSVFYQGLNRGKKSIAFDVNAPAGRQLMERLLATATPGPRVTADVAKFQRQRPLIETFINNGGTTGGTAKLP